jgi:hypothetical protein
MTSRPVASLIVLYAAVTTVVTTGRLPAQETPAADSTLRAAAHDALGDGRRAASSVSILLDPNYT